MYKKLESLNGVRGLGACCIAFFFHYNHFISNSKHPLYGIDFLEICMNGWMAVELFFFLSGITFMSIYAEKIRNREITGEKYFVLRFSKLWPMHIFSLIIVALIQEIRVVLGMKQFKFMANDLYDFVLNIFMMQNVGVENGAGYNWVAWTLSINVILYFLFYWVCKKSKSDNDILVASIVFFILGLYVIKNDGWFLFSANVGRGLVTFFWGVMFAIIYKRCESILSIKHVVCITISFLMCLGVAHYLSVDLSGNSYIYAMIVTATCFTFIVFIAINNKFAGNVLSCAPLKLVGQISFSLFMIHYPLQLILVTLNDSFGLAWDYSRIGFWIGYVLICLGSAYLCYEYIEKNFSDKIRSKYNMYLQSLR